MRDQACTSTRRVRHPLRALVLPMTLLLSACGGGGGGGGGGGAAPTVNLALNSSSITLGANATLTWSSAAATSCTASGAWSGPEATSGTATVTPTAAGSDTYTLTCAGMNGSTPKSATLTVTLGNGPYTLTSLVADTAGTAALTVDANLINPWGLSMAPGDPVWVANNGTQTSTLYDGNGKLQEVAPSTPGVKLPPGFGPTGIVANTTTGFVVSAGGSSGAALFIYSGTGGMLAGWAPGADIGSAVTTYTDTGGAVYTGLAIASNGGSYYLYAADFHNNKVDVFSATYLKQTPSATSFAFADSTLPAGYAPYGIQAVNSGAGGATQIYVAYAKQGADNDSTFGAGLGLVDVFDTNGTLLSHLIPVGGALNAPWGIALAPADFAPLSNDVLIGNLGDGKINAYNPTSGKFVAAVSDSAGTPLAIPGLWGIVFGNDSDNQPANTLFYAAGTADLLHGNYGRIDVGATPPALNKAPVVTITAPPPSTGGGYGGGGTTIGGTVAVTATATDSVAVAKVQFFANGTSIGTATAAPYTVQWNTTTVANGTSVALTAKATDVDGNVGTSASDTVIVAN